MSDARLRTGTCSPHVHKGGLALRTRHLMESCRKEPAAHVLFEPNCLPYVSGLGYIKRRLDVHAGHVAFVALLRAAKTHVSVRLLFVPAIPSVFCDK